MDKKDEPNLKQRVELLLQKHAPKVDRQKEIIALVCSYCQIEYGYRLYDGGRLVQEQQTPFNLDYKESISHGVCNGCLPIAYRSAGLDDKLEG